MLNTCSPFGDNGYMKIVLRESFPYWIMGEQSVRLHQASAINKGIPSSGGEDRHHQDQLEIHNAKVRS
jgi:hypothetical protein